MKSRFLSVLLLLLITSSCSLFGTLSSENTQHSENQKTDRAPDTPMTDPSSSREIHEMNCTEMGLPCSPEEADPQALERSAEIHQEMKDRLGAGESIENLRDWLSGMDDVRLVLSNPVSVVFILEGGLPVGVYDAVLAGGREEPDAGATSGTKVLASLRPPFVPVAAVVGEDTGRENEERHKRALILSPFDFEFNVPDAGGDAARILGSIPDYKKRVTHLKDDAVSLEAFRGWQDYDLILYNGHGGTLNGVDSNTGDEFRTTFITTGNEQTGCGFQEALQGVGFSAAFPAGVGCLSVKVRVENMFGRAEDVFKDYLSINPHFFINQYPGGLEKAVIIFNGCVTYVSDALPNWLAGDSSVYFGWDENVLSHFNPGVITPLFEEMAKGYTTEKAYDQVCGSGGCVDTAGKGARLQRYAKGEDLRIREIAISLHPLTGDPLSDGDKVPVYGYPGDGQVDELPFYIEVIAVDFDEIRDYVIRFEVNGQEVSGSWKLDNPETVEKWESPDVATYRILDRMILPFDFQQDQEIRVVILVDLPEGGKSKSVRIKPLTRNPVLGLESYFGGEEDIGSISSYVSGEVPLSLLEIKDDLVMFESRDQKDLLSYDAFEIPILDCEYDIKTTDGSLMVSRAVFEKDGFTNIKVPLPDEFYFSPSNDTTEEINMSCNGMETKMPIAFWLSAFITVNEKRFTDDGIQITDWLEGSGGVYAEFHWESDIKELKGEYTLQIREP